VRASKHFDWQEGAACQRLPAGFESADFYPENRRSAAAKLAKQFCGVCPIRMACLEWGLQNEPHHGIWGGLDPYERRWLRNPTTETMEDTDAAAG
jgi:WhiB family redox-sensing transcriptional regulator